MLKKTIYLLLFIVQTHTITAQSNRLDTPITNINNKIKQADTHSQQRLFTQPCGQARTLRCTIWEHKVLHEMYLK